MHCAIVADIHANLTAFTAVLDDIERRGGADEVWCLGDIVGYGPEPRECIAKIRQVSQVCILGNHDAAAIGKVDLATFNPDAAAANRWTAEQLSSQDHDFLEQLPMVVERGDFTLTHGSPREPVWEYLLSPKSARDNLAHFSTRFCLVGHTHVPRAFICEETGECSLRILTPEQPLALVGGRTFINPGAVGQPRDGDPRASYATYDDEAGTVTLHRIPYDIQTTQARMMEHGLPTSLVTRLSQGV